MIIKKQKKKKKKHLLNINISLKKLLADILTKCVNGTKISIFTNQIFVSNEN